MGFVTGVIYKQFLTYLFSVRLLTIITYGLLLFKKYSLSKRLRAVKKNGREWSVA